MLESKLQAPAVSEAGNIHTAVFTTFKVDEDYRGSRIVAVNCTEEIMDGNREYAHTGNHSHTRLPAAFISVLTATAR